MFQRAKREKAKLRLALCGVAGSGKTYSALRLATGMGGKIALIDTEHKSACLYGHEFVFDDDVLLAPYTPARYIEKIKEAESLGYDILIIDSLTHAWVGQGGVLEMADRANKGNYYAAWRSVSPEHDRLVETILTSKMHIIATIRAKPHHDTTKDEKGKMVVQKVGLAPVQREGLDYEFTTVLDISLEEHIATASKDRTHIFDGKFIKISEETGQEIMEWLNKGVDREKQRKAELKKLILEIKKQEDIGSLKSVYEETYNIVKSWGNEEALAEIINAKEEVKTNLMSQQAA